MTKEQLSADMIVDVISEGLISARGRAAGFSTGASACEPYLPPRARGCPRPVVTEKEILGKLRNGQRLIELPGGALVTPLARLLIEEERIKVHER